MSGASPPCEHRIGTVGREEQAALVRDRGTHGITPSRWRGRVLVLVGNLEAEGRLSRRIDRRAAERLRRRIGARDSSSTASKTDSGGSLIRSR